MRLLRIAVASLALLTVATAGLAAGRLEPGTWPGSELARSGPSAVTNQVVRTAAGITLAAASPTFTGTGEVTVGARTFTIGTDAFATIQAAIDAVDPGGTVWVLPGTYSEIAADRYLYNGAGPYQFGIFVGVGKPNLTIMGVTAAGDPIATYDDVVTMVNTQARNTFGTSGFFIEGDHCTITGIGVGVNDLYPQKTIEVIGEDFTIKWCDLADVWGGCIYINDYRFDSGSSTSYVTSYHVEGNNFQEGMDFQTASGAGYSGPVSGRVVTGNTFVMNPGQNWASITFNGTGGVSWFTYPVGGAIITGNTFTNTDPTGQHIKARGDYLNAQMDWASYWNDNTYNKASCEGVAPPADIRAYDYSVYTNARRIGAVIQDEIGQAVAGDIVLVGAGIYHERLSVARSLQLRGARYGVDPTVTGARTNPAAESVVDLVGLGIANPNVLLEIAAGTTDVTVAGFTLNGSMVLNYADEATIRAWDDRLAIEDNIIDGFYAIVYKGNDHFAVRRNRMTVNKAGFVVQAGPATDVTAEGNRIVPGGSPASDAQGIYMTGVNGGLIRANDVSGFTGSNAVTGSNVANLVIEQNQLAGCRKGVSIWGTTTFIEIRQNTITGHVADGIVIKGADLNIHDNVVTGNAFGVTIDYNAIPTERVTVFDNDLSGNSTWALQVMPAVLQAVNASGNWFGIATPAGVAAEVTGLVDYTPWLAGDTDTSADPGFQGDFSTLWVAATGQQVGTTGRIQEAIGLVSGSTVHVAAGIYAENVVIDKTVALQGAGDGSDPLTNTILMPAAGTTGITIQAGGTGPADRCVIRDLRVSGGGSGIYTNSTLGYLTLQNLTVTATTSYGVEVHNDAVVVDVVMTDVDLVANTGTGMRVRGKLNGLVMTNGHVDGNVYGLQSYTYPPPDAAAGNNFLNVSITGTTFNNNSSKGMYLEKLSDAMFDGITVASSGTAGSYAAGVDINLKYAAYQNIEIRNSTFTGCGTGDVVNGVGLTVKARSDGSYATYPATLTNVDLVGNTITGCQNGIRFGEPGKSNPGPTVVDVHESLITGSVGVGLDNASLNVPDASCNWWGDALGPDVPPANPSPGDGISGLATYAPWWTTATGPCDGFVPYVTPVTAGLCISTAHTCVTVPVTFTRADASEVRGISVTFQLGGGLTLCGTPAVSILKGTWLAGYDAQYGIVDNGGGSYTVDQAINGDPCGITTGGQLFTLALTATSDGTGTITVTDVAVRDCDNAALPGIAGAPGGIPINVSVPAAIANLAASQLKLGNDGDGTTKITVNWPAVEAGAKVLVYRADYGQYPEYDDNGGVAPTAPTAYPPTGPWQFAAEVSSGTTLADEVAWPNRGFWYYVAYVKDACDNVSAVSNMTTGTLNYHLGDVMGSDVCVGDNLVRLGDVSLLGGHYGVTSGSSYYLACLDVGSTTNRSVSARPTTDNKINFEDMMMFAINYGPASASLTTQPVAAVASDAVWVEGPAKVTAGS